MTLFVTVAMVSCDGDDSDGPKIPKNAMDGVETIYGKLNPTGKKSFKLYLYEKDGPTKLSIPGFPDIRIYRNRYVDEVPNPVPYYGWGLTPEEVGAIEFCDFERSDVPANLNDFKKYWFVCNNGHMYKNWNAYIRVPLADPVEIDGVTQVYGYASIRVVEPIEKSSEYSEVVGDNVIGMKLEYQSPITPVTLS